MRADGLLHRWQGRAVEVAAVGIGLYIAQEHLLAIDVGMAVRPTEFASRRQPGDRFRRVVVDVVGHFSVRRPQVWVGDLIAIVDCSP
jgi:hypothetical protein